MRRSKTTTSRAFTLVELLVVVGTIALLIGILLPALARSRLSAQTTRARADLRSITMALSMYGQDHARRLPPTRYSCASRAEYELPVELARGRYLPGETRAFGLVVKMPDVFNPETPYKYRAPGPAIMNESMLISDGAWIWVPEDFPVCDSSAGQVHNDPARSPVRYAVWSVGPCPTSPRFMDQPGCVPLPSRFWYRGDAGGGLLTFFEDRRGQMHMKP